MALGHTQIYHFFAASGGELYPKRLKRCADEYRKLGYIEADEATIKLPLHSEKKSSKSTLIDKLLELRIAKDKGLITEKEYEEQRGILLKKFSEDAEPANAPARNKTPIP